MKICSLLALLVLMGCAGPKTTMIHKEIPIPIHN